MLAKRALIVMPCIALLAACGTGAGVPPIVAPSPTADAAPCPVGWEGEYRGRFSEACIRSIVPWRFALPLLGARYEAPVFGLFPTDPQQYLRVQYEPVKTGEPRLLFEIFPKGFVLPYVGPEATTPAGHEVFVDMRPAQFTGGVRGAWEDASAVYALVAEGSGSASAKRALILAVADSVIDQRPLR